VIGGNDNVLEPPKENPGPNMILQFRFDAQTGLSRGDVWHKGEPVGGGGRYGVGAGGRGQCTHRTVFSRE
jgi:hypothetical protein